MNLATRSNCCTTSMSARAHRGDQLCKELERYRPFFIEDRCAEAIVISRCSASKQASPSHGRTIQQSHEWWVDQRALIDFIACICRTSAPQRGAKSPPSPSGFRFAPLSCPDASPMGYAPPCTRPRHTQLRHPGVGEFSSTAGSFPGSRHQERYAREEAPAGRDLNEELAKSSPFTATGTGCHSPKDGLRHSLAASQKEKAHGT